MGAEPGRNQTLKIYREKILLQSRFPLLSSALHTYLSVSTICKGGCSPPKARVQQQPCSLGHQAKRKCWEGAGTWPHTIHALNMSGAGWGGRRAQGGRNVAEGTLEVQSKPQHSQQPSPLGFRNHFKPDPAKFSATFTSL